MIKAEAALDSMLHCYPSTERSEMHRGFRARTKAASAKNCSGRVEHTYLPF